MPFTIVHGDITKRWEDAIVSPGNHELRPDGGVSGAIFEAAGRYRLRWACRRIGRCETGQGVITKGYRLHARFIIHTVGPVWQGGEQGERELLYACYKNALALAQEKGLSSIAFPLISAGINGYPNALALEVAIAAIEDFLLDSDMEVWLVVFDRRAFALSAALQSDIQAYIDEHYEAPRYEKPEYCSAPKASGGAAQRKTTLDVHSLRPYYGDDPPCEMSLYDTKQNAEPFQAFPFDEPCDEAFEGAFEESFEERVRSLQSGIRPMAAVPGGLRRRLEQLEETFTSRLLRLIDERGKSDAEVYKRANVDRRLFSKIRSNLRYHPGKNTALAFAVALELSLDDTLDLLKTAGYTLSQSHKLDVIVTYFITEHKYNIFEINEVLFAFGQSLLGS